MGNPEWCARVRPGMRLIATDDAIKHMGVDALPLVSCVHYIATMTADHYAFAVKCNVRHAQDAKPLHRTKELGFPWFRGIADDPAIERLLSGEA